MILRLFLLFAVALMGVTSYFIVIERPPTVQMPPQTAEVTKFQQAGLLPSGDLEEDEEVEHGIFDVPEMDEVMLEQAIQNMGDMPGMNMDGMSGMNMGADNGSMNMAEDSGMNMDMDGDETAMAEGEGSGGAMNMAADNGSMNMAKGEGSGGAMNMEADTGSMNMADMATGCEGEGGLFFCPDSTKTDREISLTMREWEFDQLEIEVKAGERIRFIVKNEGTTLHEFMFMTMPMMQAVDYRAKRADWSLLEHEALFEKSLLLPGQDLSFVVEVQQAGSWMFMCMLPYHMQLGMMGQIATPGAAMDMDM